MRRSGRAAVFVRASGNIVQRWRYHRRDLYWTADIFENGDFSAYRAGPCFTAGSTPAIGSQAWSDTTGMLGLLCCVTYPNY